MFLQMRVPAADSPSCVGDRHTSHKAYFQALQTAADTFSAEETKKGTRVA